VSHEWKCYLSDLSDAPWEKTRSLLPLDYQGPGRPLALNIREAINASLSINKPGRQWKNLPPDFPNPHSVY
jgi:transposase